MAKKEVLEQQLQTKILEFLNLHNIYAVKVVSATKAGVPDILCCINGYFVAIEVKRPKGGKVSELQRYNIAKIIDSGGKAIVARSVEDVRSLLCQLHTPTK